MIVRHPAGLAALLLALIASPAATQHVREGVALRNARPAAPAPVARPAPAAIVADSQAIPVAVWWAPIASAIVPGTGQIVLEQDRAIAYLAFEGYAWLRYAADWREARRQREAYRDLARAVARAWFPGPKPIGDFEYYERMESFVESGDYDDDPGAFGLQPERDTLSFNGALWLKARRLFWEHPDSVPDQSTGPWNSAIAFYESHAVEPEFRWSWRAAQLEHDLFRRTIERSNDAFRRSVAVLGIIIANHMLSTVDAYVAIRLRGGDSSAGGEELEMSASLPWAPFGRH